MRSERTEPPLPERCDAVIVGGGASGLSLASRLAATSWRDREVLIVDDASRPLAGRAWAYWSDRRGRLDRPAAVSTTFDRFRVRSSDVDHLITLRDYRYHVVNGADLGRAADHAMAGAPGFRRVRGHVDGILDGPRAASVVIDGQTVHADWVFDSVGLNGGAFDEVGPAMSIAFTGRRIETRVDTFDETSPTLMDFRVPAGEDLAFVYVLPSSRRVALVEHTRFTADPGLGRDLDERALDTYLRGVAGVGAHTVLATEHGTIPLVTTRARPPGQRVVPIGTAAGMVKPSTGYGYSRIQRHSADLARSLAVHGHPFDVPGPSARHRALDRVLLAAIAREPSAVIHAFERLFVANPGDRVLAFLDERTSLRQELATILTLPPAPFLRVLPGLLRPRRGRLRSGQP